MTDAVKVLSQACVCDPEADMPNKPYRCAFCHAADNVRAKDAEIERLRACISEGRSIKAKLAWCYEDATKQLKARERELSEANESRAALRAYAVALHHELTVLHDAMRLCDGRTDPPYHKSTRCQAVTDLLKESQPRRLNQATEALSAQAGAGEPGINSEASGAGGAGTLCVHETCTKLWECPECLFRFDAGHTNEDGGYSCPVCAEDKLYTLLESVQHEWKEVPGENSGLLWAIRDALGMKPDHVTGELRHQSCTKWALCDCVDGLCTDEARCNGGECRIRRGVMKPRGAKKSPEAYEDSTLERLDALVHELTGDEGEDDSFTVLRRKWHDLTAERDALRHQVGTQIEQYEEILAAYNRLKAPTPCPKCEQDVYPEHGYRCVDCDRVYHRQCLRQHCAGELERVSGELERLRHEAPPRPKAWICPEAGCAITDPRHCAHCRERPADSQSVACTKQEGARG